MSAEPAGRVLIASNRGPVSFSLGDDGRLTSRRGGGGVATALSALAGRAEVLWVCAALNDADRAAARAAADGLLDVPLGAGDVAAGGPESVVRMLDIPAPVFDRAYNGVANSTLWFLHHLLFDTPNQPLFGLAFRREWESFRAYNAAFADALAEGAGEPGAGTRSMVQDYHLTLVPRMLAQRRPTWRSRTSHTPRGRRRITSRCCPTTWRARFSRAYSAPTMPGFTRSAGPARSWTAARPCSAPR